MDCWKERFENGKPPEISRQGACDRRRYWRTRVIFVSSESRYLVLCFEAFPYKEPIATLIANTQPQFWVKINISDIQSLPTWHQGRVLLIGDAAHAVSPNAGQGAAMALDDAMCLAKLLRDSSHPYEQVFAQFEAGRKPRVEKIVAEGRRRGADKQVLSPFQSKIREIMIMIFVNLFGERGLDWLYSYKIDWSEE